MSFPTRKFKPKISRVRSSHSAVNQPVKIMRCPPVHEPSAVVLEDVAVRTVSAPSYRPKKTFKKASKKISPPKGKPAKTSVSRSKSHVDEGLSEPCVLSGNFLEEMKAGLDEMGEKLKKVEKELTRKNLSPTTPEKKNEVNRVESRPKHPKSSPEYNPIDFTDMDFNVIGPGDVEDSYEDETSGDSKKMGSAKSEVIGVSNETIESVISKIRDDIRNWKISKGISGYSNEENGPEHLAVSNDNGEIVVREEAERETPYESNRSSDGATKAQLDSFSSDSPGTGKSKAESSPSGSSKAKKSPNYFHFQPNNLSGFQRDKGGESSSSTLSQSIPGLRRKDLQYPLDKYLPKAPKREETFVKSREVPLQKEVSLFRKIHSLLKESQCVREPVKPQVSPPDNVPTNQSIGSSASIEEFVAAEFYKATFGIKKTEAFPSKGGVAKTNRGAGDASECQQPLASQLIHITKEAETPVRVECGQGEGETACQRYPDYSHNVRSSPPKTFHTDESCHSVSPHDTFYRAVSRDKLEVPYGKRSSRVDKCEAFSVSSVPSISVQTPSKVARGHSPRKKIILQNAGINTDRINAHVFNIKHQEPEVANDFAVQSRPKSFVVQELPRVSIRGRLVKQNCGIISINPLPLQNEIRNTAVLELSHLNEPQPVPLPELHDEKVELNPQIPEHSPKYDRKSHYDHPELQIPSLSHRLVFDRENLIRSTQLDNFKRPDELYDAQILDTVAHFKQKLSRDLNTKLEPIKQSLADMMTTLTEFCKSGLNNQQILNNVSSTSKVDHPTLNDRVERMNNILRAEIEAWGLRDMSHYNLLTRAIDELTKEIKLAVKSFNYQELVRQRTESLLHGVDFPSHKSTTQRPRDEQQSTTCSPRLDKLYAIHSFLQQYRPPMSDGQKQTSEETSSIEQDNQEQEAPNIQTHAVPFNETFTLDAGSQNRKTDNIDNDVLHMEAEPGQQFREEGVTVKMVGDYEDDFIPEDVNDFSESDSNSSKSVSLKEKSLQSGIIHHSSSVNQTVHLKTAGSANGHDSADAPTNRLFQEDLPLSTASTVLASQVSVKSDKSPCAFHKADTAEVSKNKFTNKEQDKPIVRLTNKNTNAVFELRLPEQLDNLNSTIVYNSVGCSEEIKLSFGCVNPADKIQPLTAESSAVKIGKSAPSSGNEVQRAERHIEEPVACSSHSTLNPITFQSPKLQNDCHLKVPQVELRNQSTQFPCPELESAEQISSTILNLFETKMNEMFEKSQQQLVSQRTSLKDVNVQVALSKEVEVGEVKSTSLDSPQPLVAPNLEVQTTPRSIKFQDLIISTPHTDSYNSHPNQSNRLSDYRLFRQTEDHVEQLLQKNKEFPFRMESSFSLASIPTSLSEFPIKSGSTSLSELAFPLDRPGDRSASSEELRYLQPAPEFLIDRPTNDSFDGNSAHQDAVVDSPEPISAHLHPHPVTICAVQPEATGLVLNDGPNAEATTAECPNKPNFSVLDLQPYDSDLMSEGEIGFAYTSNSYSSGEVVERKKPSTFVDGNARREDAIPSSKEQPDTKDKTPNSPSQDFSQVDSFESNDDSPTSETTSSSNAD